MAIKIEKKITGYSLADETKTEAAPAIAEVVQMGEPLSRPDKLVGNTYKIKTPVTEHALYITINDIVMHEGTPQEHRRPFEIFINSKNMEHFQWIVALTRVMSAVFRKGGDVTFLVDEMKAVFDPKGGYFKAGGVYMPSLVAELGAIVEDHMKSIGLIHDPEMSAAQRAMIAEKRKAYEDRSKKNADVTAPAAPAAPAAREDDVSVTGEGASFPPSATMCHKCSTRAVVIMDGCATCLNCGYSKCG